MKTCIKCNTDKEESEFYKKRASIEECCKACRKEKSKKVYLANRQAVIERTSVYSKTHPDLVKKSSLKRRDKVKVYSKQHYERNKPALLIAHKQYFEANKEKWIEYHKADYAKNGEAIRARTNAYKRANPDKQRVWHHKRRANYNGAFTTIEWEELCARHSYRCLACGQTGLKLTVDHVVPLSKGGTNTIANLQPLCGPCNSRKHTKEIDYRGQDGG